MTKIKYDEVIEENIVIKDNDSLSKNPVPLTQCLSECPIGAKITVIGVNAGFGAKRRLANLGIVPGTEIVKTKEAPFRGPVEISVKGSSLVLGRGIASKIIINCDNSCKI
ncbi:MAG: hypothetical protein GF383_11055 [Candidatus Lokiarchaeota archaeon]|nr:hypothetical protein [Candidatus Lokiarchaeota archaeon]MBD3341152.1 hypothetical protein [Candidatus Lokiarchaeota archaeon]